MPLPLFNLLSTSVVEIALVGIEVLLEIEFDFDRYIHTLWLCQQYLKVS